MKLAYLAQKDSIHTVRWVNEMANRGHEVHLISMQTGGEKLAESIKVYELPYKSTMGYFLNAPKLKRLLQQIKPDFFHVHFASGYGLLGRLSHFHPTILSVWGSDVYDFPFVSPLHKRILCKNLLFADKILSTSHVMANQTHQVCSGLQEIEVTPFGIDIDRFKPTSTYKNSDTFTIGTVKTLAHKYGIDILIKAFAQIYHQESESGTEEKIRLLIVGEGPQRDELVQLVNKLKVDHVTEFTGKISYDQVPNYLNRFDIYVAASRLDSESFGVAVIEASACGIPVVVSNTGGLPEVVKDGVTGLVVRKENVDDTAKAILTLLNDDSLRKVMGIEGRKHVSALYNWQDNASAMEGIYRDFIKTYRNHQEVL